MPQQQNQQQWTRRDFLGALSGQNVTNDAVVIPPPLQLGVPWITRNEHLPQVVDPSSPAFEVTSLKVTGMVDNALDIPYEQLSHFEQYSQERYVVARDYTPGNGHVGNAIWRGIGLYTLLNEAGLSTVPESITFFNDLGQSVAISAYWGIYTMLAVGVNAAPLPHAQGYPLRALLPFLYAEDCIGRVTEIMVSDEVISEEDEITPFAYILSPVHLSHGHVGQAVTLTGLALGRGLASSVVNVSVNGAEPIPVPLHFSDTFNFAPPMWQTTFVPEQPGDYEIIANLSNYQGQAHDHRIVIRVV